MRRIAAVTLSLGSLLGTQVGVIGQRSLPEPAPTVSATAVARPAPKVEPRSPERPRPAVKRNPDARNPRGDLIEISIASQRLTAWRNGTVVMSFLISTGRPGYATPKGHFRIIFKNPKVWSYKWRVWMPWSMNFYGNYFIHQLPHYPGSSVDIGANELGRPASHGCVRVGVGDAERLYRWTAVGTPVWVH